MSDSTVIEWTDATWSPWEGCTKVGPGCDHCYAEAMNRWLRKGENWGPGAPRRLYSDEHWQKPIRWDEKARAAGVRTKVFPSVCDPFDNEDPPGLRDRFWRLIEATTSLTWLLLTKRIGNVRGMVPPKWLTAWPTNIWLGATVVNQEEAERDIPKLIALPAHLRFLSCEPLLGPIDLTIDGLACSACRYCADKPEDPETGAWECRRCDDTHKSDEWAIDWVIVGGESGPHARPMHPDWARSLRDQCVAAGVPFLFKQNGEYVSVSEVAGDGPHFKFADGATVRRIGKKAAGRTLDGRTWDEFPT